MLKFNLLGGFIWVNNYLPFGGLEQTVFVVDLHTVGAVGKRGQDRTTCRPNKTWTINYTQSINRFTCNYQYTV